MYFFFFVQAEDGIRDYDVTGVQTCALPIWKGFAVRNQRFRLVDGNALFDMQKDPNQESNVIGDHPKVVAEMKAAYDEWWKITRPMMVNEKAPMSPTRPFHVLYKKQLEGKGIPAWQAPTL